VRNKGQGVVARNKGQGVVRMNMGRGVVERKKGKMSRFAEIVKFRKD